MRFHWILGVLSIFLFGAQTYALDIKFYPDDQLYLNDANPRRNTYDFLAHLVIVKNDSTQKQTVEKLRFEVHAGSRILNEVHLRAEDLIVATSELVQLKEQGMDFMADILLPPKAIGEGAKLSTTAELEPAAILTARNTFITVQQKPTHVRVFVHGRNADGTSLEATSEIKVIEYKSNNTYLYPLEGEWYMHAVPSVTSHHRWMWQTEFGIDFMKVDERGLLWKSDGKSAEDFYGYGRPVLAAADGVVVTAINDAKQNWDAWLPREGESQEDFGKRSSSYQLESMKKDLYRAVTGNLVVIEHPGGEYSAYAHLKQGSLTVARGDRVKVGQKIAEVGDTGDYYMAHLHFQISDNPDVLHARSLPFKFADVSPNPELGHFVRFSNK